MESEGRRQVFQYSLKFLRRAARLLMGANFHEAIGGPIQRRSVRHQGAAALWNEVEMPNRQPQLPSSDTTVAGSNELLTQGTGESDSDSQDTHTLPGLGESPPDSTE